VRARSRVDGREDRPRAIERRNAERHGEQVGVVVDQVARRPVGVELRDVVVAAPKPLVHARCNIAREPSPARGECILAQQLLGVRDSPQQPDRERVGVGGEVLADEHVDPERAGRRDQLSLRVVAPGSTVRGLTSDTFRWPLQAFLA
jgi:hypothetical protein